MPPRVLLLALGLPLLVGVPAAVGFTLTTSDAPAAPAPEAPVVADDADDAPRGPGGGPRGRGPNAGGGGPSGGALSLRFQLGFNNATPVARAADGTLHTVWTRDGTVVHTRTPKSGASAETELGSGKFAAMGTDGQGWLVVAWASAGGIRARSSADGGLTWAPEQIVGQDRGKNPSVLAWTEGGTRGAIVAWHSPDSPGRDATRSTVLAATWDGAAWRAPERLDAGTSKAEFVALTRRGGRAWAAWRDDSAGLYEIFVRPYAGSWGPVENTGISGRDPSVCATATHLVMGWQEVLQVYVASRPLAGGKWSERVGLGSGAFAKLSCTESGTVATAWEAFPPGGLRDDAKKTVGLALSRDNGATFTPLTVAGGRTGLLFGTASLAPDGTLDALWVDRAADAPGVERITP